MNFDAIGSYPVGFGMMLMRNSNAMDYFTSLTDAERQAVADECTSMRSREEMRAYVDNLAKKKR